MSHSITVDHEENPVNSKPCISKVHVGLRNVKPKAYDPVLVSIGPYHKANPDLQAMQQNKELYLNSLLERRNKCLEQRNQIPESREIYLAKLKKFDSEARNCYVDPYPIISNDEFAEMMLLDGCFIVEFLRKCYDVKDKKYDPSDPISRVPWMKSRIQCDMMLLENQLPYFVLSEVYNMTKSEDEEEEEKSLKEMVMSRFNSMLPRPCLNSNNGFGNNTGQFKHLLHLVHFLCHPLTKTSTTSTVRTCCLLPPQNNEGGSDESYAMTNQMGTVVELQEAGIKFEKVGKKKDRRRKRQGWQDLQWCIGKNTEEKEVSLFDIDFKYEVWKVRFFPCFKCGVPCFKCGVMKVPCFKVDDTTETLLRNLIAYEQHLPNVHPKHFTDFACLMNQLINSNKDAKVLRFEGIIMNFLGGDDELSQLFNTLTDNVCGSYEPYYLKVRGKVDEHCETICNTWMANLNRKYFNNPWAGISTVAAVFLLLLTVVQTVVALITWLA